jgi:uncharacterized protein (DUF2147 family)
MKKAIAAGIVLAMAWATTGASAQEVNKTYIRKGEQEIRVFTVDGKLFCRRTSDSFEMCYGMELAGASTYKGAKMKHPDMPAFMTFDGTVIIGDNKKMSIEGCMVGGAICDKEVWDEK